MAAQADVPAPEPPPPEGNGLASLWKKIMKKGHFPPTSPRSEGTGGSRPPSPTSALFRRVSRKVVPGLPRAKTFKRQQSEVRERLEPILPTSAERRAVSVDRRLQTQRNVSHSRQPLPLPRASAPDFLETQSVGPQTTISQTLSQPQTPVDEKQMMNNIGSDSNFSIETSPPGVPEAPHIYTQAPSSTADIQSITTSHYDAMIRDELETKWILNLSMHFRDKSKREKFFVTYRERESLWRRVTISLDYRNAPDESLEKDLVHMKYQRDKSARIYEAIRESLQDIQFYETVTNLKLQTTEGRLHVHVVEDVNEIIPYPTVHMVQHLRCRRVKEKEIQFDSHMSGFVYKVRVDGRPLIKKEIPGPDTVEEFLYEVNALNYLRFSESVIEFYGVVIDDEERVKGLLISYAENGALIDMIYDSQEHERDLPWSTREKWARQIVRGLSDIHESGFVQGDFTLSNIVIDHNDDAKIIDINRRGCPVGWEPPEATPLIDSNQRISMYIGVKSDLYQLGMVLWALATLEDEPEAHRRPLRLDPEIEVPHYYRKIVTYCLHENPRVRKQAKELLDMFPEPELVVDRKLNHLNPETISVEDDGRLQEYQVSEYQRSGYPQIRVVEPQNDWPYAGDPRIAPGFSEDPYYYPPRGRSPPSPVPGHHSLYEPPYMGDGGIWPGNMENAYAGMGGQDLDETPRETQAALEIADRLVRDLKNIEEGLQDEQASELARATGGESRAVEAASALETVGAQAPDDIVEESRARDVLARDDGKPLPGRNGQRTTANDPTTRGQKPSQSKVGNSPISNQGGTTVPEGSRDKGKGKVGAEAQSDNEHGDEDLETRSSGANYTHNRREEGTTRTTEAKPSSSDNEPRSREIPARGEPNHDLVGVGSAYDKQADNRQLICSDEDLGLTSPLAQGVTSMA